MHNRTPKKSGAAVVVCIAGTVCAAAAHAAEESFALGGVFGYGNHTRVYGVQAVWAPQKENQTLARHDLGLRVTAQVARWFASADSSPHPSLTDGSVMAELRYWLPAETTMRPFVEGGLGVHLLSHATIDDRALGTAFNFGTQVAVGVTFGDRGRYELAALIHHVSNAGLNENNYGLTYGGIRLRVALQ